MYKYYLYVIYKSENNKKLADSYLLQINKFKPTTLNDYIELAKVKFLITNDLSIAQNVLNNGIKKFSDNKSQLAKLNFAKLELK